MPNCIHANIFLPNPDQKFKLVESLAFFPSLWECLFYQPTIASPTTPTQGDTLQWSTEEQRHVRITGKSVVRLLASLPHATSKRQMMAPMGGARAPAFQRPAPRFFFLPWEPSEPKVTWLVNASTPHCPPGSACLIRKRPRAAGRQAEAGTRQCLLEAHQGLCPAEGRFYSVATPGTVFVHHRQFLLCLAWRAAQM